MDLREEESHHSSSKNLHLKDETLAMGISPVSKFKARKASHQVKRTNMDSEWTFNARVPVPKHMN
jgi:hypothetical protein